MAIVAERTTHGSRAVKVRGRRLMILVATVPTIFFYVVFLIFPIIYSFAMSFTNWNPVSVLIPLRFLGLLNYTKIVTGNLFWICMRNTIYYASMHIGATLVLGLVLATLINSLQYLRSFYRSVFYLPVLTSVVAAGILFRWIFQPRYGLINSILALVISTFGVQLRLPMYLQDPKWAMACVAIMTIWKGLGYTIVLFLAGLQGIPQVLYEAAKVDGASAWKSFWYITVPTLRPTILFVAVTGVIGALQSYVAQFIMSIGRHMDQAGGGPVNSTRTLVFLLFDEAFRNSRFGYASAIAVLIFIVIMSLILVQRRALRTEWSY
ncbi:MAG: sugar ABC transporter permease [Chloroflexi bacterium]|nr:sugar ABC transporter permease [Chloroflexota bacterium]